MRAPRIFRVRPSRRRSGPRMTLPVSQRKIRWPACRMRSISRRRQPAWRILTCFIPGLSAASRPPNLPCAVNRRPLQPIRKSPIVKAPACRRSSRIFSTPIHTVFEVDMPVPGIRSRCLRSRGQATRCSVTPGTARCSMRRTWRARNGLGVTPQSARSVGWVRARYRPASVRCCTSRRLRPVCWGPLCKPSAAVRSTARAPSCWILWASR